MDKRIEDKIDVIVADVNEIKTHIAVYNIQLTEHMRRTDLLEKKLEPVERHVTIVEGIGALIIILGAAAAIVALFK